MVEVLVGLALGAMVLGMASAFWITTVHLGKRTDGVSDDVSQAAALYSALASDLRRCQPSSLVVQAEGTALALELSAAAGGGPVEFRLEGNQVVRSTAGDPERRYPLAEGSSWDLVLVTTASAAMPGYLLVSIEVDGDAPGRGLLFEAAAPLPEEGENFPAWNARP
jgi:hypothetical protein